MISESCFQATKIRDCSHPASYTPGDGKNEGINSSLVGHQSQGAERSSPTGLGEVFISQGDLPLSDKEGKQINGIPVFALPWKNTLSGPPEAANIPILIRK